MRKNGKKIKAITITCVVLIILVITLPLMLSIYIYQSIFGKRYETPIFLTRNINEFDNLKRERYIFNSNKGQHLIGYKYFKEPETATGIVIISHGLGGGGHNTYMDAADYFAANGYIVFAYDATGNDESEGNSVRGFPQGLIDLDYAIRFIKNSTEFEGLPIMLFGHSWGAYSAGNVLNIHPDIKAIVMVAGINKSTDIIEEQGKKFIGEGIKIFMPYLSLIEKTKFGKYSSYSSISGFEASEAGIMLIHSADDEVISYENNFLKFYDLYKNNPLFVFVGYEDRGHNYVYYSDASKTYRDEYNQESILFELDTELMDRIVSFYDSYL
jgi:dipeptidyl aminopeptidase/acylaminoacyl peptidase